MSTTRFVELFRQIDLSKWPDPHSLETDRLRILWVLVAAAGSYNNGLTAAEVSAVLENCSRIAVSRQKVAGILAGERGTVVAVGRSSPVRFKAMKMAEDELQSISSALFIDPSKAYSSIRKIEEMMAPLRGAIKICDAYVDSKTLDYLRLMTAAESLSLLTENIQDSSRFQRDLTAFAREYPIPMEVRQASPGVLHDRYVIHESGLLLIGASLKDLARKQSMVVSLSAGFSAEVGRAFGRCWSQARRFN